MTSDIEGLGEQRALEFVCTNDACWYKGRTQIVERGTEASCTKCGWMMSARYDD